MTTHLRSLRIVTSLVFLTGVLVFILTSCPSNRDGMSGQLVSAKDETLSATRSAALALQTWAQHQSTSNLTAVQLADARDEISKAYGNIATLEAENPADLSRQALLIRTMTDLVGILNVANAAVRDVPDQPDARAVRNRLTVSADALDRDYHR